MMGWYYGDWGFAGIAGMLVMLLIWVAIIWLAVWAIARFTRTESRRDLLPESAREILDRRFVSGEIDEDEYVRTRRILESREATGRNPAST